MSATIRLLGGSAAITIASQPSRDASPTIRFVALRVPCTRPVAFTPCFFSALTAFAASSRCSSSSRCDGLSHGIGNPNEVH